MGNQHSIHICHMTCLMRDIMPICTHWQERHGQLASPSSHASDSNDLHHWDCGGVASSSCPLHSTSNPCRHTSVHVITLQTQIDTAQVCSMRVCC